MLLFFLFIKSNPTLAMDPVPETSALGRLRTALTDLQTSLEKLAKNPNPAKPAIFEKEGWAIDVAKKHGVLAPTVLLLKQVTLREEKLALCVQERLPGNPSTVGVLMSIPWIKVCCEISYGKRANSSRSFTVSALMGLVSWMYKGMVSLLPCPSSFASMSRRRTSTCF